MDFILNRTDIDSAQDRDLVGASKDTFSLDAISLFLDALCAYAIEANGDPE